MKNFVSGFYHWVLGGIMWIPFHPLRRLVCCCVMKSFGRSSAIYRNVDLRSPYRISVGAGSVINKKCLIDGRGG